MDWRLGAVNEWMPRKVSNESSLSGDGSSRVVPCGGYGATKEPAMEAKEATARETAQAPHPAGGSSAKKIARKCMQPLRVARGFVQPIVQSGPFDAFIMGCIVLNAISMGAQADYDIQNLGGRPPSLVDVAETFFCAVFSMELALRVLVEGASFWRLSGGDWKWNYFDLAVVGMQLLEVATTALTASPRGSGSDGAERGPLPSNFAVARILRILRLIRVLRLVRLLRFVQELRTLVCSIGSSFRSLCWTLVLLFLMIYVVSVCLTQLVADSGAEDPSIVLDESTMVHYYYGTLMRSVLSLFQAITGGVDWDDLVLPLTTHIHPVLSVVFTLYIAFAVLAMMNVVTGVFVESALYAAKADKEDELVSTVRNMFVHTDVDNSGSICWEEFAEQLDSPQMSRYFKALDIDVSDARGLFTLLDADESGEVNAEEFLDGCLRLRGPAKAIDLATLMYFNKRMLAWWSTTMKQIEQDLEELRDSVDDFQRKPGASNECHGSSERSASDSPGLSPRGSNARLGSARPSIFTSWLELKREGDRKASIRPSAILPRP